MPKPPLDLSPITISRSSLHPLQQPERGYGPILDNAPDPFDGYFRELTASGGVRITYQDQLANSLLDALRSAAFAGGLITVSYLLLRSSVGWTVCLILVALAGAVLWFFTSRKLIQSHQIEIHPDGMIVDGRMFRIEAIGENWPMLQMKNDENRLTLSSIRGTRFEPGLRVRKAIRRLR